jgi:hypothetical protein
LSADSARLFQPSGDPLLCPLMSKLLSCGGKKGNPQIHTEKRRSDLRHRRNPRLCLIPLWETVRTSSLSTAAKSYTLELVDQ